MTAFEVFDWLEQTAVGAAVRDSVWLFPVIEAGHLLGLGLLGGAVLILDLRLMGLGLRERPVAYVAGQLRPWLWAALLVMFATGIPLFLSEAVKCYFNGAFWVKMGALALALLYSFGVRDRLVRKQPTPGRWQSGLLGAVSVGLWVTVAAAGRWIGFS